MFAAWQRFPWSHYTHVVNVCNMESIRLDFINQVSKLHSRNAPKYWRTFWIWFTQIHNGISESFYSQLHCTYNDIMIIEQYSLEVVIKVRSLISIKSDIKTIGPKRWKLSFYNKKKRRFYRSNIADHSVTYSKLIQLNEIQDIIQPFDRANNFGDNNCMTVDCLRRLRQNSTWPIE